MITESYVMHIYCENSAVVTGEDMSDLAISHMCGVKYQSMIEMSGRNRTECLREAKSHGWKVRKDKALCPGCQ